MSTVLQKKLAREIVNNAKRKKPANKQELVVLGGYSETVAKAKPQVILEQKGVQTELKNLGFNEEAAKDVVQEILHDRDEDGSVRLRAASEVFKVFGTYAAEKTFNLTATASVDELKAIIQNDLAKFRPNKG